MVSATATNENPLTVTPTYYKWNGNDWKKVTANQVTFTNTFKGRAEATLGVSKSISGRDWNSKDSFTFELTAEAGIPMPTNQGGETATATESNKTPDFGTITYTKAGIYTYTITETSEPTSGMTNAPAVTATVTVTLNTTTNNLEAKVDYSDTDTNGKAKFVNYYKTEPLKANTKDRF